MKTFLSTIVIYAVSLSGSAAKSLQPNALMIMADQHNADVFGFMGHPNVKTHNFTFKVMSRNIQKK